VIFHIYVSPLTSDRLVSRDVVGNGWLLTFREYVAKRCLLNKPYMGP